MANSDAKGTRSFLHPKGSPKSHRETKDNEEEWREVQRLRDRYQRNGIEGADVIIYRDHRRLRTAIREMYREEIHGEGVGSLNADELDDYQQQLDIFNEIDDQAELDRLINEFLEKQMERCHDVPAQMELFQRAYARYPAMRSWLHVQINEMLDQLEEERRRVLNTRDYFNGVDEADVHVARPTPPTGREEQNQQGRRVHAGLRLQQPPAHKPSHADKVSSETQKVLDELEVHLRHIDTYPIDFERMLRVLQLYRSIYVRSTAPEIRRQIRANYNKQLRQSKGIIGSVMDENLHFFDEVDNGSHATVDEAYTDENINQEEATLYTINDTHDYYRNTYRTYPDLGPYIRQMLENRVQGSLGTQLDQDTLQYFDDVDRLEQILDDIQTETQGHPERVRQLYINAYRENPNIRDLLRDYLQLDDQDHIVQELVNYFAQVDEEEHSNSPPPNEQPVHEDVEQNTFIPFSNHSAQDQERINMLLQDMAANWNAIAAIEAVVDVLPEIWHMPSDEPDMDPSNLRNWGLPILEALHDLSRRTAGDVEMVQLGLRRAIDNRLQRNGGVDYVTLRDVNALMRSLEEQVTEEADTQALQEAHMYRDQEDNKTPEDPHNSPKNNGEDKTEHSQNNEEKESSESHSYNTRSKSKEGDSNASSYDTLYADPRSSPRNRSNAPSNDQECQNNELAGSFTNNNDELEEHYSFQEVPSFLTQDFPLNNPQLGEASTQQSTDNSAGEESPMPSSKNSSRKSSTSSSSASKKRKRRSFEDLSYKPNHTPRKKAKSSSSNADEGSDESIITTRADPPTTPTESEIAYTASYPLVDEEQSSELESESPEGGEQPTIPSTASSLSSPPPNLQSRLSRPSGHSASSSSSSSSSSSASSSSSSPPPSTESSSPDVHSSSSSSGNDDPIRDPSFPTPRRGQGQPANSANRRPRTRANGKYNQGKYNTRDRNRGAGPTMGSKDKMVLEEKETVKASAKMATGSSEGRQRTRVQSVGSKNTAISNSTDTVEVKGTRAMHIQLRAGENLFITAV